MLQFNTLTLMKIIGYSCMAYYIYLSLHMNPIDGMSELRQLTAAITN